MVKVLNGNNEIIFVHGKAGENILQSFRDANEYVHAPCSGRGICGKCRVRITTEVDRSVLVPPEVGELCHLSDIDQKDGIRLACLALFRVNACISVERGCEDVFISESDTMGRFNFMDTVVSGSDPFIAVDIGTTTIAVALVGGSDKMPCIITRTNRQKGFGVDVISRIQACIEVEESLKSMHRLVVEQVGEMISVICATRELPRDIIKSVFVSGNTTMLHLFKGENPKGLAAFPFSFNEVFLSVQRLTAGFLGIRTLASNCIVELLPCISAFVGADITAGILASGLNVACEPQLLIDIGTNGEMVLAVDGKLIATATAAGSAFEGGQIKCGCSAILGAINRVHWEGYIKWFSCDTIGDVAPVGICGSGLVDITAALINAGFLEESGELVLPEGTNIFYPVKGYDVFLSQSDIRQIQLAKGAVAAGVAILCEKAGIMQEDIKKVYLAGGFGAFLDEQSAITIGLLSECFSGKVNSVGNSSLIGTAYYGADMAFVPFFGTIEVLDLSSESSFQYEFVENMLFPENL